MLGEPGRWEILYLIGMLMVLGGNSALVNEAHIRKKTLNLDYEADLKIFSPNTNQTKTGVLRLKKKENK
jgi:hypothetical protein